MSHRCLPRGLKVEEKTAKTPPFTRIDANAAHSDIDGCRSPRVPCSSKTPQMDQSCEYCHKQAKHSDEELITVCSACSRQVHASCMKSFITSSPEWWNPICSTCGSRYTCTGDAIILKTLNNHFLKNMLNLRRSQVAIFLEHVAHMHGDIGNEEKKKYFLERAEQMKKRRENGDQVPEETVKRVRGSMQQKRNSPGHVSKGEPGNRPQRFVLGFELGEVLGAGGFSWVVEGHRHKDKLDVAMKFIHVADKNKSMAEFAHQKKLVRNELNLLKSVKHKNVIKLLAYQKVNYTTPNQTIVPTYCFVMEKCSRFDLFDYMYWTGVFSEQLACTIFKQIVAGVLHMHKAGFIHRDLKAQNVVFTDDFQVKIIDFGWSKELKGKAMYTTNVGTSGYQAPEILLQRPYSKKCDAFSLGVLLFMMLSGHPPFKQAMATDPWFRNLARQPPQYKRFWYIHKNSSKLSETVRNLIQNCLCYQPAGRFTLKDISKHSFLVKPGSGLQGESYRASLAERLAKCVEKSPTAQDQLASGPQLFTHFY